MKTPRLKVTDLLHFFVDFSKVAYFAGKLEDFSSFFVKIASISKPSPFSIDVRLRRIVALRMLCQKGALSKKKGKAHPEKVRYAELSPAFLTPWNLSND